MSGIINEPFGNKSNPQKLKNTLTNPEHPKTRLLFAVFWALLDLDLGSMERMGIVAQIRFWGDFGGFRGFQSAVRIRMDISGPE